ncbi:unnamed protein product [Prorocentrum cordatum]|uniref:Uncharacterized protein n=1 Tax=Prorocentrum cordatum TaxID=2364126 RepID=A0ABN9QR43_9DINO|nr:unnamed protein product [Polarella glacialis]
MAGQAALLPVRIVAVAPGAMAGSAEAWAAPQPILSAPLTAAPGMAAGEAAGAPAAEVSRSPALPQQLLVGFCGRSASVPLGAGAGLQDLEASVASRFGLAEPCDFELLDATGSTEFQMLVASAKRDGDEATAQKYLAKIDALTAKQDTYLNNDLSFGSKSGIERHCVLVAKLYTSVALVESAAPAHAAAGPVLSLRDLVAGIVANATIDDGASSAICADVGEDTSRHAQIKEHTANAAKQFFESALQRAGAARLAGATLVELRLLRLLRLDVSLRRVSGTAKQQHLKLFGACARQR